MYDYAIRFEEDSAPGLAILCRDLPELNIYGEDRKSAISEALDAIETTLSIYVDQRRVIPVASAPEAGEHVVRLPSGNRGENRAMERHEAARYAQGRLVPVARGALGTG
ncbi:hypothetical protein [Pseudomonas mandelii]|uniref:type II toxin-antitoxin system HicB family antitoxin n=1 Tax=Pseudomonas mandelii TaxID=75612 RepID=UPI002DDA77E3|nr:hypothetical protein [Pseudomonas mandelii]